MTAPLNERLLGKLIEFFRADTPDGERLAALDKSIAVLAQAGLTWPVLWQAIKVASEIQASKAAAEAAEPDWQDDPDDEFSLASHKPGEPNWRTFCRQHPVRAVWLVQNHKRSKFAASLIEGVCTWGGLTPRQAEVVDRIIRENRQRNTP